MLKNKMEFIAEINLFEKDQKNIENITKLFQLEDKSFSNNRANYKIEKTKIGLKFLITAKDAVALRACMSAITKTLSIYQRVELNVKEDLEN